MLNGDHASFEHCVDGRRATDERIAACTRALSTGTGTGVEAQFLLMRLYEREHDFAQALATANLLIDRFSNSFFRSKSGSSNGRTLALAERGGIYAVTGRLDDAMKDADEVNAISADEADAHLNRCRMRTLAGRELDLALADCDKAIELDPRRTAAYSSVRGLVNLKLGRFKEAAADFDATLDRFPKYWFALFLRGVAERRLGDSVLGDADIAKAEQRDVGLADEIGNDGVTP